MLTNLTEVVVLDKSKDKEKKQSKFKYDKNSDVGRNYGNGDFLSLVAVWFGGIGVHMRIILTEA